MLLILPPPFVKPRALPATTALWTGGAHSNAKPASVSFPGINIGTAFADRRVIATWGSDVAGGTHNSCTIGGVTATKLIDAGSANTRSSIWIAAVPIGTTATLTLSMGGTPWGVGVDAYALTNLQSATPVATTFDNTTTAAMGNSALSPPAGSCVIAVRAGASSTSSWTWTWAGLTERSDRAAGANITLTSASADFAAAVSPLGITCTSAAALLRGAFCAAVMR